MISKFMRFYADGSGRVGNLVRLAEGFCVFFKLLIFEVGQRKKINKEKIVYNLKLDAFIRKVLQLATGILRPRGENEDKNERVNNGKIERK